MRKVFSTFAVGAVAVLGHRFAPAGHHSTTLDVDGQSSLRGSWDETVVNITVPLRRVGNSLAAVYDYVDDGGVGCVFRERQLPDPQIPLTYRAKGSQSVAFQLANCLKIFSFYTANSGNRLTDDYQFGEHSGMALFFPFGFYSDDPQIRGLSHLLEHMIFLGSDKYPFDKALEQVAEEVNGLTGNQYTQYYAEMQSRIHAPEALLRLADAVTHPRLQPDMVLREVGAINSEYSKHAADDVVRLKRLIMALTDVNYPGRSAHWGNAKSLLEGADGDPEILAQKAREFHSKQYTGNGAHLAFVGQRSPDRIIAHAKQGFADLPSREVPPPWVKSRVYGHPPHTLPKRVSEGASASQNVLVLQFPLHVNDTVTMAQIQMLNPFPYLELGDKREGSFFHEMDGRGWIRNVVYSVQPIGEIFTVAMAISCTDTGFANRYELMENFFSYKNALQARGVDLVRAHELQRARELQFQFTPPERSVLLAQRVGASMSTGVHPAFWVSTAVASPDLREMGTDRSKNDFDMLTKRRMFQTATGRTPDIFLNKTLDEVRKVNRKVQLNYAPTIEDVGPDVVTLADTVWDLVSPTNMIMIERDLKFATEVNLSNYEGWTKDDFFDLAYKISDVPEEWMERFISPTPWKSLPVSKPNPHIPHLVGPRPFVQLSGEQSADGVMMMSSIKIHPPTNPLTRAMLIIRTAEMPPQSPTNLILLELISQMLKSRCDTDPALQAYLEAGYRCVQTVVQPFVVLIEVRGLADGIKEFIEAVLTSFADFDPREQDLLYGEKELRKQYYAIQRSVHEQAAMNALSALDDYQLSQWEVEDVDTAAYRMSALYRDIMGVLFSTKGSGLTWWKKIYTRFFKVKLAASMELRVHGRFSLEDLTDLREGIMKRIPATPMAYRGSAARFSHVRQLPRGVVTLRVTSLSDRDFSYGLAYTVQFSFGTRAAIRRAQALLHVIRRQLLSEYYRELRTRQQLGYVVDVRVQAVGGVPLLVFNIQSEIANPRQLRAATESFLQRWVHHMLPKVEAEELKARGKAYYFPVEGGPTHDDVKEFFMAHILPEAIDRHVLSSELWPKGKAPPPEPNEAVYIYPRDLKKELPHTMTW